ncbi:TNT domain-containing protein, partial [Streptococcus fryi]
KFDDYLRKEYALQGKYFAERVELPNGKRGYLSADITDGKPVPVRSRSYLDSEGHIKWPPKGTDGFVTDSAGNPITEPANLKARQFIDRYGNSGGRFTSPLENGQKLPYETRGLPYPEGYQPYHKYEVVKDINKSNYEVAFKELSPLDRQQLEMDMKDFKFGPEDIYNPQKGQVAKVFGQGGGIQIKLGTSVNWYEKLGFIKEVQ